MKNKEAALNLLDQILSEARRQDEIHKLEAIKDHKGSESIGKSWSIFHLEKLRELISE